MSIYVHQKKNQQVYETEQNERKFREDGIRMNRMEQLYEYKCVGYISKEKIAIFLLKNEKQI